MWGCAVTSGAETDGLLVREEGLPPCKPCGAVSESGSVWLGWLIGLLHSVSCERWLGVVLGVLCRARGAVALQFHCQALGWRGSGGERAERANA